MHSLLLQSENKVSFNLTQEKKMFAGCHRVYYIQYKDKNKPFLHRNTSERK